MPAGGTLTLHVSTVAERFRVVAYRQAERLERIATPLDGGRPLPGRRAPANDAGADWHWPPHRLTIPSDWAPGVHVIRIVPGETLDEQTPAPLTEPYLPDSSTLIVVTPRLVTPRRAGDDGDAGAPILLKLPLFTYHAYALGDPRFGRTAQGMYTGAKSVSLRRPGGGTGGVPWDDLNVDVYDRASPRQTFAHWDAKLIAWLHANGYAFDVCTDLDLHRQGVTLLRRHRLLVSAGHDEYWSDAMRDAVERWTAAGGNVAFFSGNTAWVRVAVDPAGSSIAHAGKWKERRHPRDGGSYEENLMTGVSYRNAGGKWRGSRPPSGYRVERADHWVFAGTGLRDGDVFGAEERLVGYECDGAPLELENGAPRRPAVLATDRDRTPPGFTVLAVGEIRHWDVSDGSGEVFPQSAATMGIHRAHGAAGRRAAVDQDAAADDGAAVDPGAATDPGAAADPGAARRGGGGDAGTIFTAATVDWPRVVGRDPVVARITRNVLDRLQGT